MMKKNPTSKKEDKKKKKNESGRRGWHQVLGKIWQEWLTPVDITVQTEVGVMAGSPKADVFLWRRKGQKR